MINNSLLETLYQLEKLKPSQRVKFIKLIPELKDEELRTKLLNLFYLAYDKNINYNVNLTSKEKKKILKLAKDIENNLDQVLNFIEYIRNTIKSKKQFQELLLIGTFDNRPIHFNENDWNLIFKVLDRNLNIGYKQVVKHLKKPIVKYLTNQSFFVRQVNSLGKSFHQRRNHHILPYFPFQLAEKANRLEKIEDRHFLIQPKLDGIRIVIDREGYIYTRNNEYFHFTERPYLIILGEQILELYKYLKYSDIIFDGEVFYKDFSTTQSLFNMKIERPEFNEYKDKIQFHIFDLIKENLFLEFDFTYKHIADDNQLTRYEFLKSLFKLRNFENLRIVNGEIADKDEIEEITLKYISEGYEGSVVKRLNGKYLKGRNDNWIKIKPIKEMEALVLDVVEGEGRFQNTTGSLLLKNKEGKIFRCSGMTDKQRQEFWNDKELIIGKVIEIKYQELTPDNIPRFPRFYRIREDKSADTMN